MTEPIKIRTLKPMVRISMPVKARRPQYKIVVRYNRDYPPPTPQPTPCRLWQGVEGTDGYGRRKVHEDGKVRSGSVHRWVMEQLLGRRLKPSEVVLHACDNRLCYRVDHLSVGTVADNNADMLAKGRAVKPPINRFYGECHPMAKLSARQVRDIRGHSLSGLSATTIAEMYEVSPSTIRRIVSGVRWAKGSQRDLVAEILDERAAEGASAESGRLPPKRIKPVKPLNVRSLQGRDEGTSSEV